MSKNRYLERGVSSNKEDVHNAIKNTDKGLFSNSFCKVVPDILSNDNSYCNVMHADGAGTKSILAYLYWKETNDIKVWRGIAHVIPYSATSFDNVLAQLAIAHLTVLDTHRLLIGDLKDIEMIFIILPYLFFFIFGRNN